MAFAIPMAIAALLEKQVRENPPVLTLEDLQERIGKPVYIVEKYNALKGKKPKNHFDILRLIQHGWCGFSMMQYKESDYGIHWWCYDYEPKGENKNEGLSEAEE